MLRRILLLITDLKIGGTPTVVRELAARLNAPPSVVVDVACLAERGPVADQLEASGVRVFPLDARGAVDLRVIWRLARLIRENSYDTVFSFLLHANAAAAAVAPFFRNARFIQSIQTTQPHPRWHWRVQSIVHHAADRVVVPSPSVAQAAHAWADVPLDKLRVIANATDLNGFTRGTGHQPVSFGQNHGRVARAINEPIAIGFIGRLDPIKRISDLLEAVRVLNGKVRLEIFGEGPERARIEGMIRELRLSEAVTLHGAVPRPQEALAQIDLLVLPSSAEGFGLVLIEAMAAGVPVVATDVAGIRDVVRNGETGLLVPPHAPRELAGAIGKILSDHALRERLVRNALQDLRERFTWDVVLPQYRALLGLEG